MYEHIEVILRGKKFKKMLDRVFEKVRKKYDLKQIEIEALFFLSNHPEASASDIYRALDLNKGHLSQALDSLCKKGYLTAQINPNNRRYISYEMTDKVKPFLEENHIIRESLREQLFIGITEDEIATVRSVSKKISDNIERIKIDE